MASPLSTRAACLTIALSFAGMELLSHTVTKPPQLMALVENYQKRSPGPYTVVFGTCLGDAMVPEVVEQNWGAGISVHNLSFRGSTALEWYLILSRYIQEEADLKAITVVLGGNDMELRASPWESQAISLATWADLPSLIEDGCTTPSCAIELILRKASLAWRIRPYLALQVWKFLKTDMPGIPKMKQRGQEAVINSDHMALPAEEVAVSSQGLGWNKESGWIDNQRDALYWLKKLIALAKERNVQIILIPLPKNPTHAQPSWAPIEDLAQQTGATLLLLGVTGLTAQDYLDDVHFNKQGLDKVAAAIGAALRQVSLPG
jgi:lysophospholipase L1-like esterase